jgi:UDP-N-acetylmuramoyl-tripeptide--D-alanyl-D-alanine ligase
VELYSVFLKYPSICTDSRLAKHGSIFFALKGPHFDANAFALQAMKNGCNFAIIDNKRYAKSQRMILVDDVLTTLQQLAAYHRRQLKTKIIGVTGTNGKTTTKELIGAILKEKYKVHSTIGNLNNHIGVPLTLLELTNEHELAVVEMGASRPDEIKLLTEIAAPNYGLVTNVGRAHLEGFQSFEGVMKAKGELYENISKSGGRLFLNTDNPFLVQMASSARIPSEKINSYSLQNTKAYVYGNIVGNSPFLEMQCQPKDAKSIRIKTNLIGAYNAENVLAAVAAGHYFEINPESIKSGIENFVPTNNRSQYAETSKNKLIIDTYNANPTSMRTAIMNFIAYAGKNRTFILGDMLELGAQSATEHQNIVDLLLENKLENVFLIGEEFKKIQCTYFSFFSVDEFRHYLAKYPIENQTVLIKGSRGIHLEKILNLL